ncbi:MAG: transposase [Bacteroidales bacterium]|nr:transposase [Bacteroidales bacterium]
MIVTRVEKHILNQNNEYYSMLDDFCLKAKNLYNHANYIVRQEFVNNGNWIRYQELDTILKQDTDYPDYKEMPTAQIAQQTLRLLDKNWTSFFKSIKDWCKNKDKYLGRPKLPKYKSKNGRALIVLTNQNVKLKGGILCFPKSFCGFVIKPQCIDKDNFDAFQQVRILPKNKQIEIEIVYNIKIPNVVTNNGRYLSIDIGVDNLATVTNNFNDAPVIVNGKGLKSINQYYNKSLAHYKTVNKMMNNQDYSNKQNRLTIKRNAKINDYLHKASHFIVNFAKEHNVSVIAIGHNKEWKQNSVLSKQVNQHFVQMPFNVLIQQIQYKAEEAGIQVVLVEESYTSGTSFLDNEQPTKEFYNKSRRKHRGLFKSNEGILINADVNGAFQILKKAFPNAYADGIEGVAFHPVKVNFS